jgi:hypothetical protein
VLAVAVNVDNELAIENSVREGIIESFPVGEVEVLEEEVALLAIDLKMSVERSQGG